MSVLRGEAARRVLARVRPARRYPITRRPSSGPRVVEGRDRTAAPASTTVELALAEHA